MIDNTEWLRGFDLYVENYPCPWDSEDARQGWLAAKKETLDTLRASE